MYNEERQSTRSPTTSRADSYNDGLGSRINDRGYQALPSINGDNEREDNDYAEAVDDGDERARNDRPPQRSEDQYIAALRYRFPNRPKTDYAYSRPVGPSIPPAPPLPSTTQPPTPRITTTTTTPGTTATTPRSGPYQSSLRPTIGGTNTSDTSDNRTFPRPALRRVSPEQQNTYARRTTGGGDGATITTTPTSTIPAVPPGPPPIRPNVRINEPNIETNRSIPSAFPRQIDPPRGQESIFETVPSHGGPVSYLGIGTFSQFEHCLQECLERERRQTGIASHIMRHDIPSSISALEYGYDPVVRSSPYHGLEPTTVHQFIDYPSRPTSTFSLDDVRHINVALSRSGISLFPYHRPYFESYPSPMPFIPNSYPSSYPSGRRIIGEVVSACRVVEEDPAMLSSRHGSQAVQNVWNALHDHQPFSYMSNLSPRGPYNI